MEPYEAFDTCKGVVDAFTSVEGDYEPLRALSENATDPHMIVAPELPDELHLQRTAKLLLADHVSRNPRRLVHIKELCKAIRQALPLTLIPGFLQAVWLPVHQSGVLQTVVLIAMDKESYVLDGGDKESYAHHVIWILTLCILGYSQAILNARDMFIDASKAILKQLDGLFAFIWKSKSRLLDVPCKDNTCEVLPDVGVFPRRILRLTFLSASLHTFCYMTAPDLVSNKVVHLTHYCWLRTRFMPESKAAFMVTRLTFAFHPHKRNSTSCLLEVFLDEVVCQTKSEDAFLDLFSYLFRHKPHLDVELFSILDFFHHMADCSPGSVSPRNDPSAADIVISLSQAWQRQVCSGEQRPTLSIPSAATVSVLEASMKLLRFYLIANPQCDPHCTTHQNPRVSSGKTLVARQMLNRDISLKMVFLTAYCLRSPDSALSDDFLVSVRVVLLFIKKHACSTERFTSPQTIDMRKQVKEALRSVWYPTWLQVCAMPPSEPESDRFLWVKDIKSLLEDIRQRCHLADPLFQNPDPYRPPVPVGKPSQWWQTRGCHWTECLCAFEPCHRLKLCKNCWQVLYCSPRCQTLDWQKGGHREVCLRRNVKH